MRRKQIICTLISALLSGSLMANASAKGSNEAAALIAEFNLREAKVAISKNPNWEPKKIVISLPPMVSSLVPDFEERLTAAAGETKIQFDRNPRFRLSKEVLEGADAIIGYCSSQTMQNADTKLTWLQSYYVGMDQCKGLTEAQLTNVTFTNTKRLSGPAIAEHTIAMMMSLAKGLPAFQNAQRESKWSPNAAASLSFGELEGKTMLVVGLGGIGTQIAKRAHALGMTVIATRNSSRNGPDYVKYVGLSDELLSLAKEADVIVNSLPLTAKTTGLFNKEFFDSAKTGAMFLSVGRGKSTVSTDLIGALESGQISAAGLDVTDPEPLPEDSPLWKMENVLITPHISARNSQSLKRTAILTVENVRRYVAGEALLNVVNIKAGY